MDVSCLIVRCGQWPPLLTCTFFLHVHTPVHTHTHTHSITLISSTHFHYSFVSWYKTHSSWPTLSQKLRYDCRIMVILHYCRVPGKFYGGELLKHDCIMSIITYRIAGNFQGRKPSRILQIFNHQRKFLLEYLGHAAHNGSTKVYSTKSNFSPICESFLP